MKKNYMSPVVEVNVFAVEDVVMTSVVDPTPVPGNVNMSGATAEQKQTFTTNATAAGAIVVEW